MKVYWVLAYEHYYPSVDNFLASFSTYEEAEKYIEEQKNETSWSSFDNYVIIDVSNRL